MPQLESMTDAIAVPVWMLAACLAAAAAFAVLALVRNGRGYLLPAGIAVVLLALGWIVLDAMERQSRAETWRGFAARLAALDAQALAPNGNLACLEAGADEVLVEACEKALFTSPDRLAAALALTGARLDLLHDIASRPAREVKAYAALRKPLDRALQADRYGLVAQVLQGRDGCSAEQCDAFGWIENPAQVAANMRARAYEMRLARHSATWSNKPAMASTAPAQAHPAGAPVNMNFPSAASIPPVSIMSNEPGMSGQNGVETPKSEAKPTPVPPRRPQKTASPRPQPPQQSASPFPVPQGSPFPQPQPPQPQSQPPQPATGAPASIAPE